jgi:hypothetical protein
MSREPKKTSHKVKEQRLRHLYYQRFYDAKKALLTETEAQINAWGYKFTLVPFEWHKEQYAVVRANRGLLLVHLAYNNKVVSTRYMTRLGSKTGDYKHEKAFEQFLGQRPHIKSIPHLDGQMYIGTVSLIEFDELLHM